MGRHTMPAFAVACLALAALQNMAAEAPVEKTEWALIDERPFTGRKALKEYHPYYVVQAEEVGLQSSEPLIKWHHYHDEPEIEYRPDNELLLDSSRVMDRWVRLAKQVPHTIKWEVEFFGGGSFASIQPDGVIIGDHTDNEGVPLVPAQPHKLVIERAGKQIRLQVDDRPALTLAIEADDRTPPRITAQVAPLVLRRTKLSFGNGEKLAPPLPPKTDSAPPKWEKAFGEDFSNEAALKSFSVYPENSRLRLNAQSLAMGPAEPPPPDDCFVLLHKSLPGDLRVRFRARSTLHGQPAFFGLMLNLAGRLHKEDGYFIEWNYWQVQIKKKNVRVAGEQVRYDTKDANSWMNFMVQKVGGKITMFTEGQEVLTWTDPYPPKDSAHDLFTFYSWKVPMEFDDLVIERNSLDGIAPRADDPAQPANFLQGQRDGPQAAAPGPDVPTGDF